MTTRGFFATHAEDAVFGCRLRPFFECRGLGTAQATAGRVVAHAIRAPRAPRSDSDGSAGIGPANAVGDRGRA